LVKDSLLLEAMNGKYVERHPVWFMRQAGRYLDEYASLKNGKNIFDVQSDPETSSEITVLPVKKLGVDAAILYSDIMIPIRAIGYPIRIDENVGPIAERKLDVSDTAQLEEFARFDCKTNAPYVLENIRLSISKLPDDIPLIGFSGGPFTLFSYLIEGGPSRSFESSRMLMRDKPDEFRNAMESAADMIINYLNSQVHSGVSVVQLFDSWAGYLSDSEYNEFILEPTKKIFSSIESVPKIYFSAKTGSKVEAYSKTGCDFLSIDSDARIKETYDMFSGELGIQGNLSPQTVAFGSPEKLEEEVNLILDEANGIRKFIFNLSHGVLKETKPDVLKKIVETVKSRRIR